MCCCKCRPAQVDRLSAVAAGGSCLHCMGHIRCVPRCRQCCAGAGMRGIIIHRGEPEREGGRATRDTASLPPRAAVAHFRHAGRRFVRRDIGVVSFSRVMGCGGCRATTGHRSPISFLGSARVQAGKQTPRRIAQTFHFLASIGRSFHETKDRREDRSCRTPFGANPPHLRTSA